MEQHNHLLGELEVEIKNLVPTIPKDIKQKAKEKLKELKQSNPTEEEIREAMHKIGFQEFPYRKAYNEMKQNMDVQTVTQIALEQMDNKLNEKIKQALSEQDKKQAENDREKWMELKQEDKELSLHDLIKNPEFEQQFNADENHQIEHNLIQARDERERRIVQKIEESSDEYDELVEKWKQKQEQMHEKIKQLQKLADKSSKWEEEIQDEADNLKESWSIVVNDPKLKEIEKKLEYWQQKTDEGQEVSSNNEGVEMKEEN